ncbi:MAG TPA: c-type cytochrome [Candidatus Polarisedimenticolia bacterium]|nr:c-type cytochrome [Candidatus Polarisedimenticolia bacterium]
MAKPNEEFLRKISALNVLFAACSIGLLVVLVWMVQDDYSRGWKGYQQRFQRLEAEKTRAQLDTAEKELSQDQLKGLKDQIDEAQRAIARHARDLEEAEAKLKVIENIAYKDDLAFRTIKSTYDAERFDFEEARHGGLPAARTIEAKMDDLEKRMNALAILKLDHEKDAAAQRAVIKEITGKRDAVNKQIDDLNTGVARLEKKLDKVAPRGLMRLAIDLLNAPLLDFVAPTIKIQQVVLNAVPIDINFSRIPRADRCQTCHLSADRAGFEEDQEPYRTHPRLNLFAGASSPHPVDRFGCTPCHGGRDRAVDFTYAVHIPDSAEQREAWEKSYGWERDHYWDFPMLAKSRIEAGCLKCHQGVVSVPEAPGLNHGLRLVERYGCFGCHKMRGFADLRRVGPPLDRITSKTSTDWMARWIRNPKAFRPSTRMPRLFGLSNHQGPGDPEREEAELLGIVAYLAGKAQKFPTPALPGRGDPGRGERLVKTVGCMGCHAIEKDEVAAEILKVRRPGETPDPVAWERRFGPDLSRIGSKARPEWIYAWITNPRAYFPETRMPSLRLSQQEALDITAYLSSLKDDSPATERAAAPRPQPQARDAALRAILTQRMTPADADAKLAAMSEHDKDAFLGERTIARLGCFGCHLIPGFEKTPPIGVELSEEGSKHADLLYFGYVKIPHTSPAWFQQKLRAPRSFDEGKVAAFYDRLRMPQFDFTDADAASITLVLQGLTKEKVPLESVRRLSGRDQIVEAGRKLVRDYNCQGCHILDGAGGAIRVAIARNLQAEGRTEDEAQAMAPSFAPPIIEGEGDKVQPDWLFGFLKAPSPIRPWLAVRMPTFGFTDDEADTLVQHFAAKDKRTFPFQTFPQEPPRGAEMQAAVKLVSPEYLNCWSCHQRGSVKPQGPPEGWAPDLTLANRRLNADWIARWIENPQKLMPGTKMPTFYDPEDPKGSAPPDILAGDPHRQIELVSQYIFTLGLRRSGAMAARP